MTETLISKVAFYKRLADDNLIDSPHLVDFEVIISEKLVTWHYRLISNVIFKERVVFSNVEINSGIAFLNCKFEKGVVFNKVNSTNFNSSYNPNNCSVSFKNCKAEFIAFENDCFFKRSVSISDESQIERVSMNQTQIENSGFQIKKSTISYLEINKSKTEINLSNSNFSKLIRVDSLLGNIVLRRNKFEEDLMFWNIEGKFILNYNNFKDRFDIDGSRINNFVIIGDIFEKKGTFENRDMSGHNHETYLRELHISDVKLIEGFDFNGLGKDMDVLRLPITPTFEGLLKFDGWNIQDFLLSGVNQNLKLLFKRTSLRSFMIIDFTNYSDISFDKCRGFGDCTLNLSDCDLGLTKFNEFEFDSFLEIRIDNATLDNIKLSSCTWFKDEVLSINGSKTDYKRKREIYRQFKQALKTNGNQIESLIFQANELSTYSKELDTEQNKSLGDKVIMWISKSNDFGLNWIKPALILSIVTFAIYLLILPGISGKILFSLSLDTSDIIETWEVLTNNFKTFWNLFNPVRSFDLTYGDTIQSDWIYFIDLVHRVFLGIMIFQIIKAFRKYVSN